MDIPATLVPIALFICATSVIWAFLKYSNTIKTKQQETIQKIIDSGQAISPEIVTSIAKPIANDENKDFSRGVLLIALAIAMTVYGLFGFADDDFTGLGVFPFALGAAFLFINKFKSKA